MARRARHTLSIVEYSGWHDVEPALTSDAGLSRDVASRLLERSARRIQDLLQSEAAPLQLQNLRLKAEGFGGAIALSTTVELEVAPRCLCGDTATNSWRDDFLFIAKLAKQGKLAPARPVDPESPSVDILGEAFASTGSANHRRNKLQTRPPTAHFEFEGEFDSETEGLRAKSRRLAQAGRVATDEHARYRDVRYSSSSHSLPAYLLDTRLAWRRLIARTLKRTLPQAAVRSPPHLLLGTQQTNENSAEFAVIPDLAVDGRPGRRPTLLLNARYRGRAEDVCQRTIHADVFEALAITDAASARGMLLVYPHIPFDSRMPELGRVRVLEKVVTPRHCIVSISVDIRGIGGRRQCDVFGERLWSGVQQSASDCGF